MPSHPDRVRRNYIGNPTTESELGFEYDVLRAMRNARNGLPIHLAAAKIGLTASQLETWYNLIMIKREADENRTNNSSIKD